MVKLSAELKLDNEKALREKDRELEDAKAAIDNKKKKKKKKKEKKKKKRKSKECLSSDDDSTSSKSKRDRMDAMAKQLDLVYETNRNLMAAASTGPKKKQQRRRPVVSEDDDEEEEEKENNEDPVQQTEEDVNERFKAAAGTKQMVDILKATKKFPATWDKAQPNMGLTRPSLIKHVDYASDDECGEATESFLQLQEAYDAEGWVCGISTLLDLCKVVAKRMLFWVESITRDYWIMPYPDQDVLREVLTLTDEMFATPFDMNVNASAFLTPYPEDSIFGAGVDTLMQLARNRFKFMAPQSALGYVDKSTGARFLDTWRLQPQLSIKSAAPGLLLGSETPLMGRKLGNFQSPQ
ncbi:hypothetical protein CYMTET_6676 [Cymbomonas tetramitiformis]|uniref:Uncharacterized protein n=1 Tax=Cymbomonas tetramitiformis TaxID=36881 RepID=A0AAE0GX01_9CHLO|nr:hypothetical protein CYMTET_6676 [Cymbomonas tetramitiformis]